MKNTGLSLFALAVVLSSSAEAGVPAHPQETTSPTHQAPTPHKTENGAATHGTMMDRLDSNHDGIISAAEIRAAQDKRFRQLDRNGDGKITPDELDVSLNRMVSRCDTNKDGDISADERTGCQRRKHGLHRESR